jgi:choline/glycine/proline betaine transport protein
MSYLRLQELIKKLQAHICVPVFFSAAALIILFVLCGAIMPSTMETVFSAVQGWIIDTFGWFYMLAVALFLVLAVFIAVSGLGNVKLGPDDAEPDFNYISWFAMLFSAGMGIGLMFYSVAEPIMHYTDPPLGQGGTMEAASEAMRLTFFHWGIHAWAVYAVVGLTLAYFGFRFGLPLTLRSALYPLIGDKAHGPIGHIVDIFAILGTMFGVATSLGLGVMQVNSGLNYLFDIPSSVTAQVILIAIITAMATTSVVLGLDAGIKRLSVLNLYLAAGLLIFVLLAGPTLFILNVWIENIGVYVSDIVDMTFNLNAYQPDPAQDWLSDWTLFYWAWWLAWSPFVGMFIARVSRGRTVREFVIGVLLVPLLFTTLWMTTFGNTAIDLDMGQAGGSLAEAVNASIDTALFKFLEYFPFSSLLSLLATILVITFFVTSSDSGSLVIDIIASGGHDNPPVWQRIFWAVTEGVVAAVLLVAGGLEGLQTASIAAALPFTVIMLVLAYGLLKGLKLENTRRISMDQPAPVHIKGESVPWQNRLRAIILHPDRRTVRRFLKKVVQPALSGVARELRDKNGLSAEIREEEDEVILRIYHEGEQDFLYGVTIREYQKPVFAFSGLITDPEEEEEGPSVVNPESYCRAEVVLMEGGQRYDIHGYTKEQVISDVLSQYERHVHFLHMIR